ncbi:MAG: 5'-methylthioadenosine/S-adenosylhomocysteine nucleosidase [Limisphaerales bacterium]
MATGGLGAGLVLGIGCRTPQQPSSSETSYDPTPRLAIVSAFLPELEKLKEQTEITGVRVIHGRRHYLGRLAGHRVVLVLSGVSMVNATLTAQCLIDHFALREIVFSGIAGGVNPNLRIGDVTVPAEWGQYQEALFARQTPSGWETGDWPTDFPNYGMIYPQSVKVTRAGGTPDGGERRFWFPVDAASLRVVEGMTNTLVLSRGAEEGHTLAAIPRVVAGGRGVSGPTFVDNAAYREWVWQTFHADALDMETAAVATVAYVNRVPFIAFRSLSDLAGGGSEKNEMPTFFGLAAGNSATVVLGYLRALDENQLPARP